MGSNIYFLQVSVKMGYGCFGTHRYVVDFLLYTDALVIYLSILKLFLHFLNTEKLGTYL